MHPAGDLVDGVVAADVLHVDERARALAEDGAVDGAGLEVEARGGVDGVGQRVEVGGADGGGGEGEALEALHHVAEDGADGAAGGAGLLLELRFVVGGASGADDDGFELGVVVDGGDGVVAAEHALVEEVAGGEVLRVVADRHHGDDLLGVEEDGQRALLDDAGLDGAALVVDAGDGAGQARGGGVGGDQARSFRWTSPRAAR